MARWKACVEFLLSVIGLFFYLLRLRRYKANGVKISGEGVVPEEYFLVSTKLDIFCYPTA